MSYKDANSVFAVKDSPFSDVIRITGDPALTGGIPATLSGVSGKWVLSITGGSSKIQLDHIKITGSAGGAGGGVRVLSGAELTLQDGTLITGNKSDGNRASNTAGGGVQVNNAKLVMRGGEISGNEMTSRSASGNAGVGGGVFITGGGSFEMTGGVIKGNTAQFAVGVYVFNGTFKMYGGLISGNISDGGTPGGGAGVEVAGNRLFEMFGGEISGNKHYEGADSNSGGGGVWVAGTFRMSGTALIANNSSHFRGGGVCVTGTFELDTSGGARITGNTAITGNNVYRGGTFRLDGLNPPDILFDDPIP
jgi:predicted outer membrane repeat protein